MARNLGVLRGLVHSQRVLLALTQKDVSREEAYGLVQRNAMKVWAGEDSFENLLNADPDVRRHLSESELADLFDPTWHFSQVETIFARVFGEDAGASAGVRAAAE